MTALALALLVLWANPGPGAGQDPGARAFQRCLACHALRDGPDDAPAPDLAGVYARSAAGDPRFAYSPALRAAGRSGLVWDGPTLDRFLADPEAVVPGTSMPFQGGAAAERAAVIDYLRRASGAR